MLKSIYPASLISFSLVCFQLVVVEAEIWVGH